MKKEELIKYLKSQNFSKSLVKAFERVNRAKFVSENLKDSAYLDMALSIGHEQTISQPSTIAFMLEQLEIKNGQNILEIGSGSGYVLALLSEFNKKGKITGIERIKELANKSKKKLKQYKNVKVIHGNALTGLKDQKFDRILASAAFKNVPKEIIEKNLEEDGIFVGPVKDYILEVKKSKDKLDIKEFGWFAFVPIIED